MYAIRSYYAERFPDPARGGERPEVRCAVLRHPANKIGAGELLPPVDPQQEVLLVIPKEDVERGAVFVITSYSIHYTKLYDEDGSPDLGESEPDCTLAIRLLQSGPPGGRWGKDVLHPPDGRYGHGTSYNVV